MNRYGQIVFFMLVFMLLDMIWLGFLMGPFYKQQLGEMLALYGGEIVINGPAAVATYVCLALGPYFFIFPHSDRNTSLSWFAFQGALMGLVVYGVFEFGNKSFLLAWGWPLVFVDLAWGIFVYSASMTITGLFTRGWK